VATLQWKEKKKKLVIKLFTYDPNYIKRDIIYIEAYTGGKAVNGGYFWVVILPVIFFSVLHISVFFKFSTMTMSYFIIQKKHRLLKHSSDVLIIRMYLDIINMWEQYYCVSSSRTFFRVHFLLVINLHSLFYMCYNTLIRR